MFPILPRRSTNIPLETVEPLLTNHIPYGAMPAVEPIKRALSLNRKPKLPARITVRGETGGCREEIQRYRQEIQAGAITGSVFILIETEN